MSEAERKDQAPPASPFTCPECGDDYSGGRPTPAAALGLHRKQAHGVAGKADHKGKGKADRAPAASSRSGPGKRTSSPTASLRKDLERVIQVVGSVVGVADPYCGGAVLAKGPAVAEALAALAATDPRIARWLRGLGKAGPYGALLIACGELAVPIAAHHGLIPPELAILSGMAPPPPRPERAERLELVDVDQVPATPEPEPAAPAGTLADLQRPAPKAGLVPAGRHQER